MTANHEKATLAGGCFWCLEAVFEQIDGVESVVSGYCGGHVDHPDYAAVCTGQTGHAEAVQLTFDPARCSYRTLLEVFFAIHDPTTRDRQGNDVGSQYRSAIFYHTDEQRQVAKALVAEFENLGLWRGSDCYRTTSCSSVFRRRGVSPAIFSQKLRAGILSSRCQPQTGQASQALCQPDQGESMNARKSRTKRSRSHWCGE
jgi:methionine-S-sulfoxide reductase